ncbi:MAG: T9SS type A sorting domain-containing protein [Candidatus Kapabacteria bacterium]|nr:T9SS type A sorting domain-containing protein [Candidatus Kapabacteria bacterium]
MVLAVCSQPAFADKAKRAAGAKAEVSKAYVSPINGAVSATIRALNIQRGQAGQKQQAKVNVGADTSRRENRFLFARAAQDVFTARIELVEEQTVIDIGIYNMLGKKVMDVYKGYSSRGQHDYTQPIPDLPEGVYICIMQGSDFRKAEKFYFSR